jgi:hypothetical protein
MEIILILGAVVAAIFLTRLFGAWMLRIDEVVKYQKEILLELRRSNGKGEDR